MCRAESPDERELSTPDPSAAAGGGGATDFNNSLVVSHVAAQLAQIGDKLQLKYEQNRKQDEARFTVKAVCVIALFVALRIAL